MMLCTETVLVHVSVIFCSGLFSTVPHQLTSADLKCQLIGGFVKGVYNITHGFCGNTGNPLEFN